MPACEPSFREPLHPEFRLRGVGMGVVVVQEEGLSIAIDVQNFPVLNYILLSIF